MGHTHRIWAGVLWGAVGTVLFPHTAIPTEISDYPAAMIAAGVEAVAERLPGDLFEKHGVEPGDLVSAVFAAMERRRWQPIDTAPKDRVILLGLETDTGFRVALGQWQVLDEPVLEQDAGAWSTATWWGAEPTHWAPVPRPPQEP